VASISLLTVREGEELPVPIIFIFNFHEFEAANVALIWAPGQVYVVNKNGNVAKIWISVAKSCYL
jgi:hypothetical protein